MKIAFYTLGCKVNQYETQAMLETLQAAGHEVVSYKEAADLYIVNSCTVTAASNAKTRQAVRRFKRNHPGCAVALAGCMPQAYPGEAEALSEADVVIGNTNHQALPALIDDYFKENRRLVSIKAHTRHEAFAEVHKIEAFAERTRAILKIEDGCDRYCAYCIIPYARGHIRSKPLEEVRAEAEKLAKNGYQELVLVGINLSAYGKGTEYDLVDAVQAVCGVDGILRVRLGSIEPDHLTEDMIHALSGCEKLCPQFHLSLQSGCDATLKRMNRHYGSTEYRKICAALRNAFPDCTLTTDVMVGFPGETPEDFAVSKAFVQEIGFEKLHVFPYSQREGTPAATMPDQVSKAQKETRCKEMIAAGASVRADFMQREIGRTVSVLFETEKQEQVYEGYTMNYTPVRVSSLTDLCGGVYDVKLQSTDGDCCYGVIV